MPLPKNCAACTYHQDKGLCRRHAPHPGRNGSGGPKIARWLTTRDDQRCGEGSIDKPPVPCVVCIHWYQPDGRPVGEIDRRDSARPFWTDQITKAPSNGGYCTRNAPAPWVGESGPAEWSITDATDSCGDGEAIPDGA